MARTPPGADDESRLQAVQARMRELVGEHEWLREAVRQAFLDHKAMCDRYKETTKALGERKRCLVRDLLTSGRVTDPSCEKGEPALHDVIKGVCPARLAAEYSKRKAGDKVPPSLQRRMARAALAALDREGELQAEELTDEEWDSLIAQAEKKLRSGRYVRFECTVTVARPSDWCKPLNPHVLVRTDLARYSEQDYQTVVLHWLGGLADAGATRPIVEPPRATGDLVNDAIMLTAWRYRSPVKDNDHDLDTPRLSTTRIAPSIAEQMLADVESWVKLGGTVRQPPLPSVETGDMAVLPTFQELIEAACKSADTIRRIRSRAGIVVRKRGGAARNRRYSRREVDRMIKAALSGNFVDRIAIAAAWGKWSSNKAADKPQSSK